jgi:hypothetical protein
MFIVQLWNSLLSLFKASVTQMFKKKMENIFPQWGIILARNKIPPPPQKKKLSTSSHQKRPAWGGGTPQWFSTQIWPPTAVSRLSTQLTAVKSSAPRGQSHNPANRKQRKWKSANGQKRFNKRRPVIGWHSFFPTWRRESEAIRLLRGGGIDSARHHTNLHIGMN